MSPAYAVIVAESVCGGRYAYIASVSTGFPASCGPHTKLML